MSRQTSGHGTLRFAGATYLSFLFIPLIYENVAGIREVYVTLLNAIGHPVNQQRLASARLLPEKGSRIGEVKAGVTEVFARVLADLENFCLALSGEHIRSADLPRNPPNFVAFVVLPPYY